MKVAIVHDFLIKNGGAEKVLEVLHAIYPDAPIYTLLYNQEGTKNRFSSNDYQIITSYLQSYPNFIRKRSKLLLYKFPKAIEEFDLSSYDIVISNSNSFAHGVITKPNTLHVCYCQSPTRYLWDWHHEYLEENNISTNIIGIKIREMLSKIRIWDYCAASRVDDWIANSQNVADRLTKYYRVKSKIFYPSVNINKIPLSTNNQGYYLIISRLSAYKKIDLAVKAFNKNGKKLIVVGEGSEYRKLKEMANTNITFKGYLEDNKVIELLTNCKALIFPGEEDFGLTPIEAMAAGKPVIAFNKGGVRETVINNITGLFFNQPTPESLNDSIIRLDNNYDSFIPSNCRKRAEEFSTKLFKNTFSQYINYLFNKKTNAK